MVRKLRKFMRVVCRKKEKFEVGKMQICHGLERPWYWEEWRVVVARPFQAVAIGFKRMVSVFVLRPFRA